MHIFTLYVQKMNRTHWFLAKCVFGSQGKKSSENYFSIQGPLTIKTSGNSGYDLKWNKSYIKLSCTLKI